MDFLKLALREARKNAARTALAIFAVALASAAVVVSRSMPHGYPTGFRLAERQFVGGDLVVWSAVAPIDPRDQGPLVSRPFGGSDWQSHALYFLPSLAHGYLAEPGALHWGPVQGLEDKVLSVDEVASVSPYLVAPCLLDTPGGPVEAILRGRDIEDAGEAISMAHLVVQGRNLEPADRATLSALVPLHGGLPFGVLGSGQEITVRLLSAEQTPVTLRAVGGYDVVTGEAIDYDAQPGPDGRHPVRPVYWERLEIIVSPETFARIAGDTVPVYQISATVAKISELEAVVQRVRDALGPGYAVYSVPQLAAMRESSVKVPVLDTGYVPAMYGLSFILSGVIVSGSVYVLLSQQRRKVGLLRVIGATRRDIFVYVLGLTLYVTIFGAASGFLAGKVLSLIALISSDMTVAKWLSLSAADLMVVGGLAVPTTVLFGLAVGYWASRIPCGEVLRRE